MSDGDTFIVLLQITFVASLLVSMPLMAYYILKIFMKDENEKEKKRLFWMSVLTGAPYFVGAPLGFFVLFPTGDSLDALAVSLDGYMARDVTGLLVRSCLLGWLAGMVYIVPLWWALFARKTKRAKVVLLNLAAGWTVLGWILALKWAVSSPVERQEDAEAQAQVVARDEGPGV